MLAAHVLNADKLRAGRGDAEAQTFRVPSKSKPGTFNVVTVTNGVPSCECSGFAYRGNCSHSQAIARDLARVVAGERGVLK